MKKVYLAGPFFTDKQKEKVNELAELLKSKYEVFVPMEHKIPDGEKMENEKWGKAVFEMDKEAIDNCDFAVIMDFGFTSDAGTAWETGYMFAMNKPAYVISYAEGKEAVHSMMMYNGCAKFYPSYLYFAAEFSKSNIVQK